MKTKLQVTLNRKWHVSSLSNISRVNLIYLILLSTLTAQAIAAQADIIDLKTEYLSNPIGLDTFHPRFTWKMKATPNNGYQTSYSLIVGTDSAAVAAGKGSTWISSKQSGDNLLMYKGSNLLPFTKYFWSVTVWDNQKRKLRSGIASFETGMMSSSNWSGEWISDQHDEHYKPAPYFRKAINIAKKIKSARVYIATAGLHELYINGAKVGNHRLDPMYTRFDRRNLYVTHDVTAELKSGKNAIGVLIGNGWFNHQSTAVWNFDKSPWRARPTFCLDLRITYTDGTAQIISSGRDWKTSPSPIVFNSIYTGEHFNALEEQQGWNTINFNDETWDAATLRSAPSQKIVAQSLHPIRDTELLAPVSFEKINSNLYLYKLAKNIAGVSEVKVKGSPGTVLRVIHSELLAKNGRVELGNIDYHYHPSTDGKDPFQTDIFTLSGKGIETFRPKFNYKGFQYIQVESNKPIELTQQSLRAHVMHSDVPAVGSISSSNETLNKIWLATNNSYLSNLFGYPTDCPQREKNGWTGDAHIAIETALYNFDGITVYEKWLADHRDEQQPNGVLPAIVPTSGWGYSWANGPDWTSSIAIIPWQIYRFYGDTQILADNYEHIRRYAEHINSISVGNLTDWGLGDWVPVKSTSSVELTSSIYYFNVVDILAKSAKILNKPKDALRYQLLAEAIKKAINDKFLDLATGIYASGTQTELSAPLYWKIVPESMIDKVAAQLAAKVKQDGSQIDVGLLGSKTILGALSENGYAALAYTLASGETFPSWGWWIKNGATTLAENWDVTAVKDNSKNHIMFGEIGAWYYKALGGIKPDEANPGFKKVLLQPQFVDGLSAFSASYDGRYGKVTSSWKKQGQIVDYTVVIPPNSSATLMLPKSYSIVNHSNTPLTTQELGKHFHYPLPAGTHQFTITTI